MTAQIQVDPDTINLGVGQPDPALLPGDLFVRPRIGTGDLGYGKEAGDNGFRHTLAAWLTRDYGLETNGRGSAHREVVADELLVTNGSSNALDMICTQFARAGDTVLVEDPTYFLALRQFADHGLKAVAVPMDGDGVEPAALERLADIHDPAFFYTVPSFHNPTGITQPDGRRRALVELAAARGLTVVADEVYQSLYFDAPPPPPLACYAAAASTPAPVLSIGSFSKILAPGLRLGWLQGAPELLERFTDGGLLLSGGGLAPVTSALVEPLLAGNGLDRYLDALKATYRKRRDVLDRGLRHHCGDRLSYRLPEGGFFIWAALEAGADAGEPLGHREAGVKYQPGRYFSASPDQCNRLRLCFAYYDEERLEEGCRRLGELLS